MKKLTPKLLLILLAAASLPAAAERADRNKPINLEADKVTVDDRNKVHTYSGNVSLTQGTMAIRAEKIVVSQDAAGFFKGVASGGAGGLARIRQKREGRDEYMDGEAERIEHDGNTERTQFFNRAYVKSGADEVRGQYVLYDALSENYTVTSGADGTVAKPKPGQDTRVRVVIQPRSKEVGKPEAPKPEAKPAPAKPEAPKPDPAKPEAPKPEAPKPEPKAEAPKPEAPKPDAIRSDAPKAAAPAGAADPSKPTQENRP